MKTTRFTSALFAITCATQIPCHGSAWLDFLGGSYTQMDPNTITGTTTFLDTVNYPNLAGPVKITIVNTSGTGLDLNGLITTNHRTSLSGLTDAPPGNYPVAINPANGSIMTLHSATAAGPLTTIILSLDFSLLAGGGLPVGSFQYVADIDYDASEERAKVGPDLTWLANFQIRDTSSPADPGSYSTATPTGGGSYLIAGAASGDWGAHALQTTAFMTSMTMTYEATNGAGGGFGVVGVPEPSLAALALAGFPALLARRKRRS